MTYRQAAQFTILGWIGIGLYAETHRWEFLVVIFGAFLCAVIAVWRGDV
jgi:hypothetical protein